LIGRDFAEIMEILWGSEVGGECTRIFRHTLATGERYVSPPFVERRYDLGEEQAYDWQTQRVTLADGKYGVVCYFQEITALQKSERALCQSEQRMRLATEATEVGIWEWNLATGQVQWDAQMFRIYGIAPTADGFVDYRDWSASVFPEDLPEQEAILQDIVRQSGQSQRKFRIRRQDDGTLRWIEAVETVRTTAQGQVERVVGTNLDITERKQQQQEIVELNARLHRAVYEGSHRIKNHLQILAGMADMQMPEGNEQVSADVLQRMKNHIQALAAIHDVLTLTTKENAENDVLPIKPLLERLIPMLQLSGGTHRIRFDVEDALLSANQASSLVLVLNELVSNAIKHGKGEVDATLKISKGYGVLEVCDDGSGFPAGFNAYRAANIGLDIIGSIARTDLRGQVVYDNHPGGGGRVTVTFPLLITVKTQENALSPE